MDKLEITAETSPRAWGGPGLPAASTALVRSTLLAVLVGDQLARVLSAGRLRAAAGLGFVAIGVGILAVGRA